MDAQPTIGANTGSTTATKGLIIYIEPFSLTDTRLRIIREDRTTNKFLAQGGTWGNVIEYRTGFDIALGEHEIEIIYFKGRIIVRIDGEVWADEFTTDIPALDGGEHFGFLAYLNTGNVGSSIGSNNTFKVSEISIEDVTSGDINYSIPSLIKALETRVKALEDASN